MLLFVLSERFESGESFASQLENNEDEMNTRNGKESGHVGTGTVIRQQFFTLFNPNVLITDTKKQS